MTRRGQYLDFTERKGGCTLYCGIDGNPVLKTLCGAPKTHIVKWTQTAVGARLRHFTCAAHAKKIVLAQQAIGAICRAYRIKKDQRQP